MNRTAQFIILIVIVSQAMAQSDTIIISSETMSAYNQNTDLIYKLFIETHERPINHLWKFDLIGFTFLVPSIGYEQRIGQRWSSNTTLKCGLITHFKFNSDRDYYFEIDQFEYGLGLNQQFRYYHNLGRRELLGKKISGFSGNFITLSFYASYNSVEGIDYDANYPFDPEHSYNFKTGIYYGLQRRIGNIGFVEGYLGITAGKRLNQYGYDPPFFDNGFMIYTLHGTIRAGLAIESFRNLKRALNR